MLTVTLTNDQVTPQLIPAIYASTQIILSLIRTPANQDLSLAEMLNSGRHMQVHLCISFQRKYCVLWGDNRPLLISPLSHLSSFSTLKTDMYWFGGAAFHRVEWEVPHTHHKHSITVNMCWLSLWQTCTKLFYKGLSIQTNRWYRVVLPTHAGSSQPTVERQPRTSSG